MRRFLSVIWRKWARLGTVTAIVALGASLSWFEPQLILLGREWVWDQMVRVKPRAYDPDLKVSLVDIDEASLAAHGQWPWPRARIARLVDALREQGVKAIGFDIIFAEPDRTSLSRVFEGLQLDVPGYSPPLDAAAIAAQPDNDEILAAAISKVPTVLALSVEERKSPIGRRPLENLPKVALERRRDQRYMPYFPSAISALPALQKAAAANASIDLRVDADGITRRAPLLFKVDNRTVLSLALAAVYAAASGEIAAATMTPGFRSVSVGKTEIPTDLYGQMRLYDSGSKHERYISADAVMSGRVPDGRLKDAIVIVGTGAEGLNDLRLTPLDQWTPGMETHAQFIEQILSGDFLQRPAWAQDTELMVTLVVGLLLLLAVGFNWVWVPPWAIAGVAVAGLLAASWMGFSRHHMLLDPAVPGLALLLAAALDRFLLVMELRRERGAVRSAFSHYLAPAVVEQLAENPDQLTLGGERRQMTMLFCDIRGFTAISEHFGQDPEGLTHLINRFLTPMTNEIMNRHGTIDKYMGDCIMAFWNAPLDDPSHAAHACEAALAMHRALKDLNERLAEASEKPGKPIVIKAGVGLNTGSCVVGNMGSDQRFDYSVLGDSVNLAARLEGQSKTYGVDTLIGEDTQAAVQDYAALEVDLIAVKGRAAAVHVFALLGDPAVRASSAFSELDKAQTALLTAYRARQWAEARPLVRRCRDLASDCGWNLDVLYDLYDERLDSYEAVPPPPEWNGIYVAEFK